VLSSRTPDIEGEVIMTTSELSPPAAGSSAVRVRRAPSAVSGWRMRPPIRKAALVVHIVAAGAWIGIDVILAVLVFTALLTTDPGTAALCYQVMPLLIWPITTAALTCLVSGVVLGLGTHHGLVRYWWVAVKLVLNLVLIVVLLRPGLQEAAEYGRRLGDETATVDLNTLIFPPIVSSTALVVATILAVYKPWGRIRSRTGR
jgi:uncharacterized membrane protein